MGRREFMIAGAAGMAAYSTSVQAQPKVAMPPAFRGMMPILATPVDAEYKVDLASLRREIDYCVQCGAAAIGHFAYASEFQKISDSDRSRMTDVAVEHIAGRVPFYAGVTGKTSSDTLRYAKEAAAKGADLIMCSLPYETKTNQEETLTLFKEMAQEAPVPIIIQDTPQTADVFTPEFVVKLVEATGQIHSFKAESDDFLTKTADLLNVFEGKLQVIGGAGGKHLIHLLRLGVTAFMTGTEPLELHAEAVQSFLDGDEENAASTYFNRILPYLMFYGSVNWLRNLKWMLHARGIIDTPNMCQPEDDVPAPFGPVVMREFEWTLNRIGWRKRWPDIV
ncbi:MAG: dihydrodipicolinate synthase family protein [Candidatus Hydrogenedentota bacterium]